MVGAVHETMYVYFTGWQTEWLKKGIVSWNVGCFLCGFYKISLTNDNTLTGLRE